MLELRSVYYCFSTSFKRARDNLASFRLYYVLPHPPMVSVCLCVCVISGCDNLVSMIKSVHYLGISTDGDPVLNLQWYGIYYVYVSRRNGLERQTTNFLDGFRLWNLSYPDFQIPFLYSGNSHACFPFRRPTDSCARGCRRGVGLQSITFQLQHCRRRQSCLCIP
ncbi:hypothetical protein F4680DRAFT_420301 [Xylaria scruposa]|nr:hypothetical protein F4680DRAFT_420301 [Xylaria scruposa]